MKLAKIELPFGLNQDNVLMHISDIESGKNCNCICPSCREPLIAAKGERNQHHFKHAKTSECETGLESSIHLAAKQIILERKQIALPEYIISLSLCDSKGKIHHKSETVVPKNTTIIFDHVQEEVDLTSIRADLLANIKKSNIIIEIFYRHKVAEEKLNTIKELNISAIEIDLSDLEHNDLHNWDAFWRYVSDVNNIKWLYNKKVNIIYSALKAQLKMEIDLQERKYINIQKKELIREQKRKEKIPHALDKLKASRGAHHISMLRSQTGAHPLWIEHSKWLKLTLDDLPYYLNIPVPDGDWIFGCDRRVWQTAFYSDFVADEDRKQFFTVREISNWLTMGAACRIPSFAILLAHHKKELIENGIRDIPSSWRTLRSYFNYLCKLNILKYIGRDSHPESFIYQAVSKTPVKRYDSTLPPILHQ